MIAAVAWLEKNQPGRPIVIWGQSLGSAAALFAAEELGQGAGGKRVHGYVLECPYRDLWTAVRNRTRTYLPPLLDSVAYTGLVVVSPLVLEDVDRISPVEAAAKVPRDLPVLLLAGGEDRRAQPQEAREIQQRLGPQARLIVIEGADHLRLLQADPEQYRVCVTRFLDEASSRPPDRFPGPGKCGRLKR